MGYFLQVNWQYVHLVGGIYRVKALERVVKPMVKRGGYIAGLDHFAVPGTTYDDCRYYSQQLSEKYGKPNRVTRFDADLV